MAKFMTRVELHGAKHGDDVYEKLHANMEAEGFSRKILGGNGTWYHLPPAEYRLEGDSKGEDVRTKAKRAADKTGKTNAVLVSTYSEACWDGLTPVK